MAFPAEVVTTSTVGIGPIILSFTSDTVGRVVDFEIELATGIYQHKGGGNKQQTVLVQETEWGSGIMKITLDEVPDFDAATVVGLQALVSLKQVMLGDATKMWEMTAATAHVSVESMKGERNGKPTLVVLKITPFAAVGSSPWAIGNAVVAA